MARKLRFRVCPVCGRQFEVTTHNRRFCSRECYQEHVRAKAREYQREKRWMRNGLYRLVHDALPESEGGFSPGAHFSWIELRAMLQHGALLPGTVLEHQGRGILLEVVDDGGLKLVPAQEVSGGRVHSGIQQARP